MRLFVYKYLPYYWIFLLWAISCNNVQCFSHISFGILILSMSIVISGKKSSFSCSFFLYHSLSELVLLFLFHSFLEYHSKECAPFGYEHHSENKADREQYRQESHYGTDDAYKRKYDTWNEPYEPNCSECKILHFVGFLMLSFESAKSVRVWMSSKRNCACSSSHWSLSRAMFFRMVSGW